MANAYKMTDRDTRQLIVLRASNSVLFTGRRHSASRAWRAISREMGLRGLVSSRQLKKKWDNLSRKYKECKHPPEGIQPRPWPWFHLMEEALSGRLHDAGKVLELPVDDQREESDLITYSPPPTPYQDINSVANAIEMAPIENDEDMPINDQSGTYDVAKTLEKMVEEIPKVSVEMPESAPSLPQNVPTTQPQVLYATLQPDSTASVASNCPTTAPSIVVQAKPIVTNTQNTKPTVLYATLLPDSTAGVAKNCMATNRNVAYELAEVNKKLGELRKEKLALEKEQAEFDRELIHLERERVQLNKDRMTVETDRIEIERDRAILDMHRAELEKDKAMVEKDRLILERDRAILERDRAFFERDKVFLDRAKEDFERQKEQQSKEKDDSLTEEAQPMDVTEKNDNLATKMLQILHSETDQEDQETKEKFASLVQKLVDKM